MTGRALALALAAVVAVLGSAPAASAGGLAVTGEPGRYRFPGTSLPGHSDFRPPTHQFRTGPPHSMFPAPQQHVHRPQGHARPHHFTGHPHTRVFIVPQAVYVAPSYRCVVPGYWAHQWIPQSGSYNVWAPGQWSPEGTWIDGHYETRPYGTGYYHTYWVPERWDSC